MLLYLVQHGEAVPKDVDPDRPLSEGGRDSVRRLGAMLAKHDHRPARVFHSGKRRAAETAEILAGVLEPGTESRETEGLGAKDSPEALVAKLSQWTDDAALVSHMPLVGKLAAQLLGSSEDDVILAFEPGSIACLERSEDASWVVNWFLRPDIAA